MEAATALLAQLFMPLNLKIQILAAHSIFIFVPTSKK